VSASQLREQLHSSAAIVEASALQHAGGSSQPTLRRNAAHMTMAEGQGAWQSTAVPVRRKQPVVDYTPYVSTVTCTCGRPCWLHKRVHWQCVRHKLHKRVHHCVAHNCTWLLRRPLPCSPHITLLQLTDRCTPHSTPASTTPANMLQQLWTHQNSQDQGPHIYY
jgi:hypothetical protein